MIESIHLHQTKRNSLYGKTGHMVLYLRDQDDYQKHPHHSPNPLEYEQWSAPQGHNFTVLPQLHGILPLTQDWSTSTAASTFPAPSSTIVHEAGETLPADTSSRAVNAHWDILSTRVAIPHPVIQVLRSFFAINSHGFPKLKNLTRDFFEMGFDDSQYIFLILILRLQGFELYLTQVFPNLIQLMFNAFVFNSSHSIQFSFQSGFRESHIYLGVFEIIQHWGRGMFSTIMRTQIGSSDDILKIQKSREDKEGYKNSDYPPYTVATLRHIFHFIDWLGISKNCDGERVKEVSVGEPFAKFQFQISGGTSCKILVPT